MNQGINYCWPTPVMKDHITSTDLLSNVIDHIMTTVDLECPPSDFQKFDILKDGSKVMEEFRETVVIPAFEKFIEIEEIPGYKSCNIRSWVTGAKHGYVINPHNHSGASLSGVFYLMFEENESGGKIIFQDPRFNANRGYKLNFNKWFQDLKIMPVSGDLLIFPSYLYHYTEIFTGHVRLALAVDFIPIFDESSNHQRLIY